ncbi:hypothetical protein QYM36_012973 [Artemia franciscana]|uniref:Uncharacterized protein n=1 Tax=Artemia franciscana TaxID=6661 RepID=A0AA88L5Y1_ARTSF|nr:hypothetical protein QYM36_012973 [Artemia franciscana]
MNNEDALIIDFHNHLNDETFGQLNLEETCRAHYGESNEASTKRNVELDDDIISQIGEPPAKKLKIKELHDKE